MKKIKTIVEFETAVALKEAGFPQPDMAYWNCFWYDKKGEQWFPGHLTLNPDVFAPTAMDILAEMRDGSSISIMNGKFICHPTDKDDPIDSPATKRSENPAEAAAQAWLFIHNSG